MEKLLIYRDKSRIEDFKKKIDDLSGQLNLIYTGFLKWNVTTLSSDDLFAIVKAAMGVNRIPPAYIESIRGATEKANIEELRDIVIDHLKTKAVESDETKEHKVFGFRLNKSKLKDLIEIPEPPVEILKHLDEVCAYMKMIGFSAAELAYFELVGSKIKTSNNMIERFEESCCHFATTESEVKMAKELFKVCAALNAFQDYMGRFQGENQHLYDNPALFTKHGKYYPSYSYIKQFA